MITERYDSVLVGNRCMPRLTMIDRTIFTITIQRKLSTDHCHLTREALITSSVRFLRDDNLTCLLLVRCG